MALGGLQKTSLIDYPGKVSCVLFLSGCNFDCPYCHNPELAKSAGPTPTSDPTPTSECLSEGGFYDFLRRRQNLLDGVVISGGEPTLEQDLPTLCSTIKQMGYPVKLDTNGSRPGVLEELINDGLIDYIAMDIKTDPRSYQSYIKKDCNPDHILKSIRIIMGSNLPYEFRTTCVKPIVEAEVIRSIARIVQGAQVYALQGFDNRKVLHPEFFKGAGAGYGDAGMKHLKSMADPWVRVCIIR